ncbi:MAG: hypothetical protein EHM64_09460 [Ignavibacteriae bacterium]|nr:MAG: hypothetical protein EHM64_09460 [Ignavibacteriota bacterium]
MMKSRLFPTRIRDLSFWHYQIAGWSSMALFQVFVTIIAKGWSNEVMISIMLQVAACFFLTSMLRLLYRRIRYENLSLLSMTLWIAAGSFGVTLVWFGFFVTIEYALFGEKFLAAFFKPLNVLGTIAYAYPDKLAWCTLYFGIKLWRNWLEEREQTDRANEEVQRAQLQMLRYQLNPHFLFNALNSVRALVDEDTRSAKLMVTELSEFLRYSLVSRNKPLVTLKEELDAVRLYLSIEQQRYEDKLQVITEIDPETDNIFIPSFVIHPLIEDALRCGMQTSAMPLRLKIQTLLRDHRLRIRVTHSGEHLISNGNGANEILESGLGQAEARLRDHFPNRYQLTSTQDVGEASLNLELALTNGELHEEKTAGNYYR